MTGSQKKTVLVSPLDWGLGHATRCVPVIQELINQQTKVILGISGMSGQWLKLTFPHLESVHVPYREIKYHRCLPMEITATIRYPSVRQMIVEENNWLRSFCAHRKIDGIISDNRYGLYHPDIPSVCITHQLYIQPGKLKFIKPVLNNITRSYLKPFHQVWVPDFVEPFTLSGSLSHPPLSSHHVQYIGPLSRFYEYEIPSKTNHTYTIAFIISGIEPQRSIFEKRCLQVAKNLNAPTVIIRGTNKPLNHDLPDCCQVINLADTEQLYQAVQRSEWVVGRAGYSSVMDWYALQKNAILVPTPGQTEQEYLAAYLKQSGLFHAINENELTSHALSSASFSSNMVRSKSSVASAILGWLKEI